MICFNDGFKVYLNNSLFFVLFWVHFWVGFWLFLVKRKQLLSRNWTKVAIFCSLCTPQKFHTSSSTFVLVALLSKRWVVWTWQQLYYFIFLLLHLHRVWSSWGFRSRDRGGSDGRRRRSFAGAAWGSHREVKVEVIQIELPEVTALLQWTPV